jgi:hypothetical protein
MAGWRSPPTSNEIRLYDATASICVPPAGRRPAANTGSRASGPGLGFPPVADIMLRRITVLDAEGNTGREYSLGGQ